MSMLSRPIERMIQFVFIDPVRPLEVLYTIALSGWAFLLLREPSLLLLDNYSALSVLPAWFWALVQIAVALVQIAAMILGPERGITARFVSMTLAAGLWTPVAIGFWISPVTTFGAFIYAGFAVLAALAGVWLGWARQNLRS